MRRSLSLACLVLVLICALPDRAATANLGQVRPARGFPFAATPAFFGGLSAKDRMANFEKIWHSIQDNYYDPGLNGVNWDEVRQRYRPQVEALTSDQDFYKLMERMTSELHDAHTHVLPPAVAETFKKRKMVDPGIRVDEFEGKLVITELEAGSGAEKAGIAPGMSIATVNGRPVAEKLAENAAKMTESSSARATRIRLYASVLGGAPGTTTRLGLLRADGSPFETAVTRGTDGLNAQLSARLLPSGYAYIHFNVFYPPVAGQFQDALEKFDHAPGLIIDLRWNPGGSGEELMAIAGSFFSAKTVFARNKLRTRDTRPIYVEHRNGPVYDGPVVILVNQYSGSSSELFAGGMQEAGRARVVGSQTCGCVLGVSHPVELKGGGLVMISKVLWFTPAGRKLEGEGVIPDKTVTPTLSDIVEKRDPVLAAGEQLLQEMLATNKQAKQ